MKRSTLAFVAALGCGVSEDAPPEPALPEFVDASPQESDDAKTQDPLQARRERLTQWSRCLMRTGSRLERSWARLGQDVDTKKLRVRKRDLQPFFDTLDGELLDACPLGAEPTAGVPPELPTQGRAYVLAARGYGNRAAELREYFDTQGYVSDKWAKLQAELPGLEESYEAAHVAATAFATTLEAEQDKADAQWLDALGRGGEASSAAWHVTNTAVLGRAAFPCITQRRPIPQACKLASDALTSARDGLEAWHDAHPAEAVGVFWLDVFRKRTADLELAIAGLQAPISRRKSTATEQLAAASSRVAEARAALQTAANTVVFDFP
ncbi:MAG: hypothetical protein ACRBN8_31410 [Nannocystales bacterium]